MSNKDAELSIGADGSQAEAEFDKVANSAEKAGRRIQDAIREASYNMAESTKAATDKMNSHFESLKGGFEKVNKVMGWFAVVMAGGAVFKEGVEESVKLTREANNLGKQFGITATEASVLNVALDDCYISNETMVAANQKLTKSLGTNEQAFKNLGVQTRDSNGNFRSSLDIMLDVNTHLLNFKEGIDRNIEGQKIYGKSWGEVQGILRLTTDQMEQSRQQAEQLGLVVGKENVEATANYRAAMNDVKDVLSAVKKAIGDALLPILTDLGNWFSSVGPQAVTIVKGAIGGLATVFYGLKMVIEIVWEVIKLFVKTNITILLSFAEAVNKALTFDFDGAKTAWKNGSDAIAQDFGAAMDNIMAKAEHNRDQIANLFTQPTATDNKQGGETSDGNAEKTSERLKEWKAELEARNEAEGNFFKSSLASDAEFWESKLAQVKKGSKEEAAIKHELYGLHKQLAVQKFNDEQEALKVELAGAHQGGIERINIATDIARRVGETYGWESREYLAAVKDVRKAADDYDKEQQKLEIMKVERARDHNVAMINMERDRIGQQKALGQISETGEIDQLKALKEREYQIEVQAQMDKIALMKEEGTARQQQLDDLAKMQDKHNAEIGKLDNQRALAVKKEWESILGPINSAFEKSITGMIQGTQTMQKAMANIGQAILAEFVNLGVKTLTNAIANNAAELMASKAKDKAVSDSAQAAASKSMSSKGTEATAVVSSNAAEGAAGAASSQAAIPVVGPGLAAASFASTMAMILGAGSLIKSSAGGEWRVPTDRLNIVHKDETILPAHLAAPMRDMFEGGGKSGGDAVHLHTQGGDWVHKNDVTKLLKLMKRNFVEI